MTIKFLDEFLNDPFSSAPSFSVDSPLIIKSIKRLLSFRARFFFLRKTFVNGLIAALIDSKEFLPFGFCVDKNKEVSAYMIDNGDVHISVGAFKKTSPKVFLTVLFHEIAHVYISQQKGYGELKKLDKSFREIYGEKLENDACTPIEAYARAAAFSAFNSLLGSFKKGAERDKILYCIEAENIKIEKIKNSIDGLKNI